MFKYSSLDVKKILRPILKNYNRHVLRFLNLLKNIDCELVYEGPENFHDHIRDKTVYACSVRCYNDSLASNDGKRKYKSLKCVFPIMIGSNLDFCIRKQGLRQFTSTDLTSIDFLDEVDGEDKFHPADIAATFFLINGCVRQLPYSFTNDPTNTHVIRGQNLVRCYTYDTDDRGKELSYYSESRGKYKRGDVVVILNDGKAVLNEDSGFFDHCPYRTEQKPYMIKILKDGSFDIDHLGNKIFISPGHLFVKLFTKYLYRPLKSRDWPVVKSRHALVVKSIETGTLLHVLSKKTIYLKENPSTMTVVNNNCSSVIGSNNQITMESDGRMMSSEVYVEKNSGCYREITMQTYPLNPYVSHLMTRQISNKVKKSNVSAYHSSYAGFMCLVGTFETKNVGRTSTMVRNTVVSTRDDIEQVYKNISIIPRTAADLSDSSSAYYVVINEACIPVTLDCFQRINLDWLKYKMRFVECYRNRNFILIRYKMGLFYKKLFFIDRIRVVRDLKQRSMKTIWVTARDEPYWKKRYRNILRPTVYDQLTGYLADLNPYFHHNVFTKDILAFNTLKNAVLATDRRYLEYFMESLSGYTPISPRHRLLCKPVDSFSNRFALYVPLLTVAYMSFKGLNQEDCIVVDRRLRAFDCVRFHTVRIKFETPSTYITFHPTTGDPDPEGYLLGHLVCHDSDMAEFQATPLTMHAKLEPFGQKMYKIYFNKSNFTITSYNLTEHRLTICMIRRHRSQTGDKLSSFHGQKGVTRTVDRMPVFAIVDAYGNENRVTADMLVDPCCFFRITMGQLREAKDRGGRDFHIVWNSDGKRLETKGYGIFVGSTLYFNVSYFASEHIYAPKRNAHDKILGQPVKGRSRTGGMRMGTMEITNGMRGNGLASCYDEKVIENSDCFFYRRRKRTTKNTKRRKIKDLCIENKNVNKRKRTEREKGEDLCFENKNVNKRKRTESFEKTEKNVSIQSEGIRKRKEMAIDNDDAKKRKTTKDPPLYEVPIRLCKSTIICIEEQKTYKCDTTFEIDPCLKEEFDTT